MFVYNKILLMMIYCERKTSALWSQRWDRKKNVFKSYQNYIHRFLYIGNALAVFKCYAVYFTEYCHVLSCSGDRYA